MQQQASCALRLMIEARSRIFWNIGIEEEDVAAFVAGIRFGDTGLAFTKHFYFTTSKCDPRFVGILDEVIVARAPVLRHIPFGTA